MPISLENEERPPEMDARLLNGAPPTPSNETRSQEPRAPSLRDRVTTRIEHLGKWLRPGMRVKRWLVVAIFGIFVLVVGVDLLFLMQLADLGDRLNELFFDWFRVPLTKQSLLRTLTYQ